MRRDIFGKEVKNFYGNSNEKKIIDNLQEQLSVIYLYLEAKGLLNREEFIDLINSKDLAERLENINNLPDEDYLPVNYAWNGFALVEHTEQTETYFDANPSNPIKYNSTGQVYILDESDQAVFNVSDKEDMKKLVERLNDRLNPHK